LRRDHCSHDLGAEGGCEQQRRRIRPLLRDPAVLPQVDAVVMETTYGDRLHKPFAPSVEELYQAVAETFARGGNVVIPTFALERAQELLYYLRAGIEQQRVSRAIQVFLDSPMAISATAIFERHPAFYDTHTWELFREGHDPFGLPGLHFTRETAESMSINRIVASAESVRIFGEDIAVRARVYTINGFSAHADQAELLAWHAHTRAPRTFLVHGDEPAMQAFAARLRQTRVEMPSLHQLFEL
jgi:metallo-beta-lactamase family protein